MLLSLGERKQAEKKEKYLVVLQASVCRLLFVLISDVCVVSIGISALSVVNVDPGFLLPPVISVLLLVSLKDLDFRKTLSVAVSLPLSRDALQGRRASDLCCPERG